MSDVANELRDLFLSAIPTTLLFVVAWCAYRWIVHGKLVAVLAERRERTEGAAENARVAIAAAESRSAEYEQRIRDAQLAIYQDQEVRQRRQMEARAIQLATGRKAAYERVQAGQADLQEELAKAKAGLPSIVHSLAEQITRAVLRSAAVPDSTAAGR